MDSPAGTGVAFVTVTTPAGTSPQVAQGRFSYEPQVTGISPAAGSASGGTTVTVSGLNLTGATAVYFGTTPAANVSVASDTRVTATSPPGTGAQHVTVRTAGGTSPVGPRDVFSYGAVVTSVTPASGPPTGGTAVTIVGTGLSGATSVTFGTIPAASFSVVSSKQISASSPAGTGVVDVTVTTPAGTSAAVPADQFSYSTSGLSVTSVSPSSGPFSGGTPVTITGTGFTGATTVTFGGGPATFTVDSATQVTATSPGGLGTDDVIVTTPAGSSAATPADEFAYSLNCGTGGYNVCPQQIVGVEGVPDTQVVGNFTTTDVNPQPSQFAAQISWGDGSVTPLTVVANPDGSFNLIGTHTFGEEGCCEEVNLTNISVQDLSRGRATVQAQSDRNIADAPLTLTGKTITTAVGTPFQGLIASLGDVDPGGIVSDYTATIDWGDGSPLDQATFAADGAVFDVSGGHTYAQCGSRTVTIDVSDAGGAMASTTATAEISC